MKAAVFQAVGLPLEVISMEDPKPGTGEVVVKVGRCGICGTDLHMTAPGGMAPSRGSVIGHEISGEVIELGKGVTSLKVGDRVASLPLKGCGHCGSCLNGEPVWCERGADYLGGGYAEYARAGERECLLLPADLSLADGALVEPLAVALHGVRMAQGLPGSTVTVIGAGPIGLSAIYWARRFGASRIQVVEGNAARIEMAMAMGAHSSRPPAPSDGQDLGSVKEEGAEFVFECVGKPGLLSAAVAMVRPRGTVVSLGFCMAPEPFVTAQAAMREVVLKFPILYSMRDYEIALDSLAAGHVEPRAMITNVVSLDRLPETFEQLRNPTHECKVMIDPWG
ncbi:zinc-binding dehydrogenase [Rhizobium tropici]|uniref:Zinc-binding dehydrogenase n=1 Tax=Rhizobium tropici TaxID=398 RepID=A0A5B0VQK3_RHITR|nr:alcohol dehydrogenase catalytic domain-containing protein [Rhizobium tropici]KAA1176982.1 zinc-binding dehydrogenase [Rhizobium tropici]